MQCTMQRTHPSATAAAGSGGGRGGGSSRHSLLPLLQRVCCAPHAETGSGTVVSNAGDTVSCLLIC